MKGKNAWATWWAREEGIGTLEIILIVAVIVIIAIAFRKWIIGWVRQITGEANQQLDQTKDQGSLDLGP